MCTTQFPKDAVSINHGHNPTLGVFIKHFMSPHLCLFSSSSNVSKTHLHKALEELISSHSWLCPKENPEELYELRTLRSFPLSSSIILIRTGDIMQFLSHPDSHYFTPQRITPEVFSLHGYVSKEPFPFVCSNAPWQPPQHQQCSVSTVGTCSS